MHSPSWCIQKNGDEWYVGTVDHNPAFRSEPMQSGAFNDQETAIVRCDALAEADPSGEYRVEKVFI